MRAFIGNHGMADSPVTFLSLKVTDPSRATRAENPFPW